MHKTAKNVVTLRKCLGSLSSKCLHVCSDSKVSVLITVCCLRVSNSCKMVKVSSSKSTAGLDKKTHNLSSYVKNIAGRKASSSCDITFRNSSSYLNKNNIFKRHQHLNLTRQMDLRLLQLQQNC